LRIADCGFIVDLSLMSFYFAIVDATIAASFAATPLISMNP
jgi:hypothetical protein